jgi:hypothetical protein
MNTEQHVDIITYRLEIKDTKVNCLVWGIAESEERVYDSVEDLPEWMQSKLSVLMVLDPNKINNDVPTVGKRISSRVFWIYE